VRRPPRLPLAAASLAALLAALGVARAGPGERPPLRGVSLHLLADHEPAMRRALASLVEQRLGLTHVAVHVDLHQDADTSPEPARDPLRTPSDGALTRTLRSVRALGLEPVVVPHVRVGGRELVDLRPPSWPRWFEAYRRELLRWARLAEGGGATLLAVGRGLRQAERQDAEWRTTIRGVREAFSGQLTYVASSERPAGPGWSDLDYVGLSLWEPLVAPDTKATSQPSEGELRITAAKVRDRLRRWRAEAKVSQPLLLLEVGFASQDGCARDPAAARGGPPSLLVDLEEQARCWTATAAAWSQVPRAELAGCFAWGWSEGRGADDPSYSLLDKPALGVLQGWFLSGD
jgi:hypothetical protein